MPKMQYQPTRGAGLTNESAGPGNAADADSIDMRSYLDWAQSAPGERKLLLEEDSVYAEDLVRLGLGWQDFDKLLIRARS